MRVDTRGKWRPPSQEPARGYVYAHPSRGLITVARCACGTTCGGYPSLVTFVECTRCGAEVPIRWSNGLA